MTTTSPALTSFAEDAVHRGVLAFEDAGRAGELQDALVDAGRLHDAAVEREVAVEHGEAAILGEGVLGAADDALLAVEVELVPAARSWLKATCVGTPPGAARKKSRTLSDCGARDVPAVEGLAERRRMDGRQVAVDAGRRGRVRRGWP